MKGILVQEHGGPEVMKLQDLEIGQPERGQVKIKLKAIGLNFIDIYQRRGDYPVRLPFTPGLEGSGVVEEVGDGVTSVKRGDRVAYSSAPGAYAEETMVAADRLIRLPDDISFEQGAAFPLQGMTAHYLINEYRKPQRGEIVLIHAAAGGMGLLLVQWAKHLGARVIGTVSSEEKAKIAKEAGADDIVFYTKEDFVARVKQLTENHGADLIIDGVGKSTFNGNLDAAALRGTVVIFGAASGQADPILPNSLQKRSLTVAGGSLFNYLLTRDELLKRSRNVIQGLKEGWLKLKIDQCLPLADAAQAHSMLENRQTTGKVILKTNH